MVERVSMSSGVRHLGAALRPMLPGAFRQFDFLGGLFGGAALGVVAISHPNVVHSLGLYASVVLGVILGAVVGGAAIQAAFMDQEFLRKLDAIGRKPVRYLAPFLFTGSLAVMAMLVLLPVQMLPRNVSPFVAAPLAGIAGTLSLWSVLSLLSCMAMLVQFVNLKAIAATVPDVPPGGGSEHVGTET